MSARLRPLLPWREALRVAARPWVWVLLAIALGLGGFAVAYANWEMFGAMPPKYPIQGVDDTGYYIWMRSVVLDRDIDFENDIVATPTLEPARREQWLALARTKAGRLPNKYSPGWSLVTLPAFLIGHGVAELGGYSADGWSTPYFVAIWVYHLALAALGLWWAWRVVSRFVREDYAAAAVLSLWVASPIIYYHAGRVSMAHGLLFTLLAGLLHLTLAADQRRTTAAIGWLWIGVLGALAVLVRATAVVYLAYPLVIWLRELRQLSGGARARVFAAFATPGMAAGLVLLACSQTLYGDWFVDPYAAERFDWLRPAFASSLLSPRHGLFYWHPLIAVGLAGLVWAMLVRAAPLAWGASLVAITYLNSAWQAWWFGSSYGNRAYEGAVLFAMVGLGWLFARAAEGNARTWGRALGVATAAAVVLGCVWLILFLVQAIPRQHAVTYGDLWTALLATIRG